MDNPYSLIHREYNESETEIDLLSNPFKTKGCFPSLDTDLDNLELQSNLQEKEILDLMYSFHSITIQVESIKKKLAQESSTHQIKSSLKDTSLLNNSTLNSSTISRRSVSKSKFTVEVDKLKKSQITRDRYTLMSPTVSININSGMNNNYGNLFNLEKKNSLFKNDKLTKNENSKSIDKKNLYSKSRFSTCSTYSSKHKISITQNTEKKKENILATMTKLQIKNNPTPHRSPQGKNFTPLSGAKRKSPIKTKLENKVISSKTIYQSTNSMNSVNDTQNSKIFSNAVLTEPELSHRTSYKFEPKRKVPKENVGTCTNNPNITELASLNYDFRSSFKSDESSFQNTHSFTSELLKYVKPRQLFSSTSNNIYFNNNVYYFMSNLNYKPIYEKIFSFLGIRNKLKNITRELRNSFIDLQCKKIVVTKNLKNKQLEECRADQTLDLVLELEILNHKEEKLKGFIKQIM